MATFTDLMENRKYTAKLNIMLLIAATACEISTDHVLG